MATMLRATRRGDPDGDLAAPLGDHEQHAVGAEHRQQQRQAGEGAEQLCQEPRPADRSSNTASISRRPTSGTLGSTPWTTAPASAPASKPAASSTATCIVNGALATHRAVSSIGGPG
jgi:hypothetical protein